MRIYYRDINELKPTMTLTGSIRIMRETFLTFLTMKKLVRLCVLIILTYVFFKFDRYKKAVALLLVKHLFIFIFFASEKDLVRKNKMTFYFNQSKASIICFITNQPIWTCCQPKKIGLDNNTSFTNINISVEAIFHNVNIFGTGN